VDQCSPHTVTLNPGTHTITGTAVVPGHTDITVTKSTIAGVSTRVTKDQATTKVFTQSTKVTTKSTSKTTAAPGVSTDYSGGSKKNLVGSLLGVIGFAAVIW